MSSGVSRCAVGAYVGTGAALDIIAEKVGFKPRKIEIFGETTLLDKLEWIEGMPDDTFLLTTGTTGIRTLVAAQGITPETSGFSVGTDASVNTLASIYRYVCWE